MTQGVIIKYIVIVACHPLALVIQARQELHVVVLRKVGHSRGMPVGVVERTLTAVPRPVTHVIRVSQAATTVLRSQMARWLDGEMVRCVDKVVYL